MYNAEETKHLILECAVKLIAQNGIKATSIADIVSAVGCSKGAFFYHFPAKDILVKTVFEKCHNAIEDAASEGMDEEDSIVGKLCRRCYILTEFAIRYPQESVVNSLYLSDPKYRAENGYGYRSSHRHYEAINALIEQGISNGELKDMPPLLLGEMFYNIASVPYVYMQDNLGTFEKAEYWDNIYQIIRCALAK